ncbi:MAG: hypothetical protein U9R32_05805, partial [Bacteroidota bacterium]|nr:hypothetical protein [Bacteroidota bacterium]
MKSFLVVLLVFISGLLFSQESEVIKYDSISFHSHVVSEIDDLQKRYANKIEGFAECFTQFWFEGNITEQQRQAIYSTTKVLEKSKVYFYPKQYQYFISIIKLIDTKQDSVFARYNRAVASLCSAKDNKEVNNFISRNHLFFLQKKLYKSNNISWKVRYEDYSFGYDSLPFFKFSKADLIGFTKKDSSIIYNTNAKYYPTILKWFGAGGDINWERGGYDREEIHAKINKYQIDIHESDYVIDSVNFYYGKLFKEPLIGRVEEKIKVYKNKKYISYPKFDSYEKTIFIDDFFEGVDFSGGFSVEGDEIIGSGDVFRQALLLFSNNDSKSVTVSANRFVFRDDKLMSKSASVSIYLENDSIYHPDLFFEYTPHDRKFNLMMDGNNTLLPYFNSYHNIDMYCHGLAWKIGDPIIEFNDIMGMDKVRQASFESFNYYSEERYNNLQGINPVHPLQLLSNFSRQIDSKKFNIDALREYMHKPLYQVEMMLLKLASRGFVVYDSKTKVVVIKQRMFDFLMAKFGMVDYDYLRFVSQVSGESNAVLNLKNNDLRIKGVPVIILSKTKKVAIYPKNKELLMKKNRSFLFSGAIRAGNFDFFADSGFFSYEDFVINLPKIDSMQFAVQSFKPDKLGKYFMIPVCSVLENLSGNIVIDKQKNKSGRKKTSEYPIFNSESISYVYYDNNSVCPGVYDRQRFVYNISPFVVDSLDNFTPKALSFEGYFQSNIFPDIDKPLIIRQDYSLGFVTEVDSGISIYSGKGEYNNSIDLSYEGLKGKGEYTYLTSTSMSDDIIFYPDSMNARLYSFELKGQVAGVEYPDVSVDTVSSHWVPASDSLDIFDPVFPFQMYNEEVTLKGSLSLTPTALKGEGVTSIDLASIGSGTFQFHNTSFFADTSDINILSPDRNSLAVKVENYKTSIDLVKRKGEFSQNELGSKIEFPINKYISYLDNLQWFIDEDKIELSKGHLNGIEGIDTLSNIELVDVDLRGAEFISIHPEQDSLKFYSFSAKYDLSDNIIKANNVKYIKVADIAVFPDQEMLTIEKNASMKTLYNAEILADVENKYFQLFDAVLDIASRNKYRATAYYNYKDVTGEEQKIFFDDIHVDTSCTTIASVHIKPEEDFKLSPAFDYYGEVVMNVKNK